MKSQKRKHEKTEYLHIRVSKREKDKLIRESEKLGISISEYARPILFEKRQNDLSSSKVNRVTALCQDIVTYVQEKYGCEYDVELAERIDRLWNVL